MLDLDAFGAMLREARERSKLRPIDLALRMGWSGTAPVYRYERGGPNAPRADPDTVNLFAQVLGLDYADRMTLLGFAGHIPDTEPLAKHEEDRLLELTRPTLEFVPHPAFLFDYRWRILAFNAPYHRAIGIEEAQMPELRRRGLTTIDLVWDPIFGVRDALVDFESAVDFQLLRFQLYNRLRRHEAWYRHYPACCSQYEGFSEAWHHAEERLSGPAEKLDLGKVMTATSAQRMPNGEIVRFEASQRNIHGAYGLIGMLIMMPVNEQSTHPSLESDRPQTEG